MFSINHHYLRILQVEGVCYSTYCSSDIRPLLSPNCGRSPTPTVHHPHLPSLTPHHQEHEQMQAGKQTRCVRSILYEALSGRHRSSHASLAFLLGLRAQCPSSILAGNWRKGGVFQTQDCLEGLHLHRLGLLRRGEKRTHPPREGKDVYPPQHDFVPVRRRCDMRKSVKTFILLPGWDLNVVQKLAFPRMTDRLHLNKPSLPHTSPCIFVVQRVPAHRLITTNSPSITAPQRIAGKGSHIDHKLSRLRCRSRNDRMLQRKKLQFRVKL